MPPSTMPWALASLLLLALKTASALCPMMSGGDGIAGGMQAAPLPIGHPPVPGYRQDYETALAEIDFDAVKTDIRALLLKSEPHWPADYGNYGPLMVRLAWHCSGSYRLSDGRGGCGGGRQRFDPERSWEDNTNLDKARSLLWPIKRKYGLGLSWGDLFILAGTTAIESMGGPVLGFCAGRLDEADGEWSAELGPTAVQQQVAPCKVNGQCKPPLGSTTVGLIYLNPEGPMGSPLPSRSAGEIRDTFGRMAMNDTETVALIGGGHAFGKTHGACPDGAGPSPKEDPTHPWPGKCGSGKGADAFTSGFEGPWTTRPTQWDNEYFHLLVIHEWEVYKGPGGRHQWRVRNGSQPLAPGPAGGTQPTMMMTSDIALTMDPTGSYQKIVHEFAAKPEVFDRHFAHAWYKLTTRDVGPVTRCFGPDVPPAEPWQHPLPPPPPPSALADFDAVAEDIANALPPIPPHAAASALLGASNSSDSSNHAQSGGSARSAPPSVAAGRMKYYGALFVRLAWQSASTFRVTDYLGGANGARIRFSPQADWPENAGLDEAIALLQPVKDKYGDNLSWADLIVLAGTTALKSAGAKVEPFCGGRTDASEGSGSEHLQSPVVGDISESFDALKAAFKLKGLTNLEAVALLGGGHSLGRMHAKRSGYVGSWTSDPTVVDNEYFVTLFTEEWEEFSAPVSAMKMFKAKGKELYRLKTDLALLYDAELAAVATDFAADNEAFLDAFAAAWARIVNADRFDGPTGNLCDRRAHEAAPLTAV